MFDGSREDWEPARCVSCDFIALVLWCSVCIGLILLGAIVWE